MKYTILLCLIVFDWVYGGYIQDVHHHVPSANTVIHSRTIYGGAIGGNPSRGAYSSTHYSQTVSAPARVHSVISTYHPAPTNNGNNFRNQGSSQGQFHQGSSHGLTHGYQSGQQREGSGSNHPQVVAYVSYNSGHENNHRQGYNNPGPGYNNQGQSYGSQGSGNSNQGSGYGNQGSGYGNQGSGYNNQGSRYNNQGSGYNHQVPGYSHQGSGHGGHFVPAPNGSNQGYSVVPTSGVHDQGFGNGDSQYQDGHRANYGRY